jgi:hypothetical protein
MRTTSIHFTLTASLGLCALHCSAEDPTHLDSTSGTSNATAGQQSALGATAGIATGTGGTAAGSGGSAGVGIGGTTAGTFGSAGSPAGGAGSGGSSGTSPLGAGAGGVGPSSAGSGTAGTGLVSGGSTGGGGLGGAGMSTSGGSGPGMAGNGTAGAAPSMFGPVADIIGLSCATNACHPNNKQQHANLHNTDGKLYERLLATSTTIAGADAVCASLPLVVPGSPDTSLIMTMITGDANARGKCGEKMPYKCPDDMAQTVCLTDAEVDTIRSWIAAGALP